MKPQSYPRTAASQAAGYIRIFMAAPPFDGERVFRHRFRGGITCRLVIDLQKLRNREERYLRCEWSERPSRRIISEYRRWILSVWQRVSGEAGITVMELIQTEIHRWELWAFAPGEAPKKIDEVAYAGRAPRRKL